jgi:hypothetical protein
VDVKEVENDYRGDAERRGLCGLTIKAVASDEWLVARRVGWEYDVA